MTPYKYTIHPPKYSWRSLPLYKFHYRFSELRRFIEAVRRDKTYGLLLTEWDGEYTRDAGYVCSELGCVKRVFNVQWSADFNGGKFDPDKIVNPPEPKQMEWGILIPTGRYDADKLSKVKWNYEANN